MLTADDIKLLQNALAAYEDDSRVDAGTATALLGKLTAMVAVCCGRSECGGECGNEWQGIRPSSPAQSEKVAGKGWKALHAAADAVAASADVWEGFSTQDAKVCVDAYLAYAAPRPEGMDD